MNRIFAFTLSAALLCGSATAALATTTDGPANAQSQAPSRAQIQAQVQALQAEVVALQANGNVQTDSRADYSFPSGG